MGAFSAKKREREKFIYTDHKNRQSTVVTPSRKQKAEKKDRRRKLLFGHSFKWFFYHVGLFGKL